MTPSNTSLEARILHAVKLTLANVVRDTATPSGMRHPLSDSTIEDLRQCLALISARERELAAAEGRTMDERPRVAGDGVAPQIVVFHPRKPPDEGEAGSGR